MVQVWLAPPLAAHWSTGAPSAVELPSTSASSLGHGPIDVAVAAVGASQAIALEGSIEKKVDPDSTMSPRGAFLPAHAPCGNSVHSSAIYVRRVHNGHD